MEEHKEQCMRARTCTWFYGRDHVHHIYIDVNLLNSVYTSGITTPKQGCVLTINVTFMYCHRHVLPPSCTATFMYCHFHVLPPSCTATFMYCHPHVLPTYIRSTHSLLYFVYQLCNHAIF